MISVVLLLHLALVSGQSSTSCADVADCRQRALNAAAAGDYESFHDLAWRAVQRGKPNDPDLMYLLARAQSLSGRPGDALVMLGRIADLGVVTDAATNEDFRRVRSLKDWPALEAKLAAMKTNAPPAPAPDAPTPAPPRTEKMRPPLRRRPRPMPTPERKRSRSMRPPSILRGSRTTPSRGGSLSATSVPPAS